jgi:hypothetical protein
MKKFNNYKELKNKLNIVYQGIYFNKILALDIWNWANGTYTSSVKQLIYYMISLDLKDFKTCSGQSTILTTYGLYDRNDHQELYYKIIDKLEDNTVNNNLLHFRKKIRIQPNIIIKFTKQIFSFLKDSEFNFIEKLIIAAKFTFYANILTELQKHNFNSVKKYLAFCGVLNVENLLTQYLQQNGIKTYSLQHGIAYIAHKNITIDSVNYENFQSDISLCWGQYTVDEYSEYGISSDRLIIAGYPKASKVIEISHNNKFKSCLILLTRNQFDDSNKRLLSILTKSNLMFGLKLHPSLNFKYYKQYAGTNNMTIIDQNRTLLSCLDQNEFDFAIAVNTSSYYESLIGGIPCLRFHDNSFELMYGCDDVFTNLEEFEKVLNNIKNTIFDYQKKINSVLNYTMGIGVDNYRKILLGDDSENDENFS